MRWNAAITRLRWAPFPYARAVAQWLDDFDSAIREGKRDRALQLWPGWVQNTSPHTYMDERLRAWRDDPESLGPDFAADLAGSVRPSDGLDAPKP